MGCDFPKFVPYVSICQYVLKVSKKSTSAMPLWPCCDAGPCVAARVPQKLGAAAEEPAEAALESLETGIVDLWAGTS